jgi:hypothetical protein
MSSLHTSTEARLVQGSTVQVYRVWCAGNFNSSTTGPCKVLVPRVLMKKLYFKFDILFSIYNNGLQFWISATSPCPLALNEGCGENTHITSLNFSRIKRCQKTKDWVTSFLTFLKHIYSVFIDLLPFEWLPTPRSLREWAKGGNR